MHNVQIYLNPIQQYQYLNLLEIYLFLPAIQKYMQHPIDTYSEVFQAHFLLHRSNLNEESPLHLILIGFSHAIQPDILYLLDSIGFWVCWPGEIHFAVTMLISRAKG